MEFVVLYSLGVVSFVIELLIFKTIYVYDYPKRKDYSKRLPIKVWHLLLLIIVNIRNKLKIRLLSIKEKTFTIDFTKEEFRVLKILSNQYLIKKNLKKPKSNINNDFDKYLDKKNK